MTPKIITGSFFVLLFSLFFTIPPAEAGSMDVQGYPINYEIDGGDVLSISLEPDFLELIIAIDATNDGILEISTPRTLLDSTFENQDDIFFVIVDGFETEYLELTSDAASRTLLIPFFADDTQIEIIGTSALSTSLDEIIFEPVIEIPTWIKNNAGWWAQDQIGDSDFVSGIQYLISQGIMSIPETQSGQSTGETIPDWVKNNAGWWAQDQIGDSDFVSGIQYLISKGIMTV